MRFSAARAANFLEGHVLLNCVNKGDRWAGDDGGYRGD